MTDIEWQWSWAHHRERTGGLKTSEKPAGREARGGPHVRRAAWSRPTMIEIEAVAVVNA
jgi:hypothetical protein